MNWRGGMFFAPESLVDDQGRRIIWAWVTDPRIGPAARKTGSGSMSLPRVLTLEDGTLKMTPVPELEQLRRNPLKRENLELGEDEVRLEGVQGAFLEIDLDIEMGGAEEVGIKVRCAPDGSEETVISYHVGERLLKVDASRSTLRNDVTYGQPPFTSYGLEKAADNPHPYPRVEAPFELLPDETLRLRVFLDGPILEVFVNDRQAIVQQVYPQREDSLGVALFARGGKARVTRLEAWEMGSLVVE
jgi:beta-fructofuranosidase